MSRVVYKICPRSAWDEARSSGAFAGSADDMRDGFIHLSTASQVPSTLGKFFSGQRDLVLVSFLAESFGTELKWEAAGSGQLYPHVYGLLPARAALRVAELPLGADGRHIVPEDIV